MGRMSLETVTIAIYVCLNIGILISSVVVLSKSTGEDCDQPLRFYMYGQMGIACSNLVVAFGYEPRYGPSLRQLYSLIMAVVYFAWNLLGGYWVFLEPKDCSENAPVLMGVSEVWVVVSLIFMGFATIGVCWCCVRGQPVALESVGFGADYDSEGSVYTDDSVYTEEELEYAESFHSDE